MDAGNLDTIDAADEALREALAIADLLSCMGETPPLDGTIQELGRLLAQKIKTAREKLKDLHLQ